MASAREYFQSKKNKLHDTYIKKLVIHKVAIFNRTMLILAILGVLAGGIYVYLQNKVYKKYHVVSTVTRSDSPTTKYEVYGGNILKYGMDGVSSTNVQNKNIWTQTYEMQKPLVDICQDYVAIADSGKTTIYVMNKEGLRGQINTNYPITKVRVASQGVVYAQLDDGNVSFINAYDTKGTLLAESKKPMESSGYPVDMAVSPDGKKLCVSYLYADSGVIKSNIAFYNFGSVGQNEVDNLVSGYTYEGIVYPELTFVDNNTCVAIGDDRISIFKGRQKPVLLKEITLKEEIKSAFCSDGYICLVFANSDNPSPYRLELYDMSGKKALTKNFNFNYNKIQVKKNSIIISGDNEFAVYNRKGLERFHYSSEKVLLNVIPSDQWNQYILIDSANTETIGLKLN